MGASAGVLAGILTYATPGTSAERQRFGARFGTPLAAQRPSASPPYLLAGEWPPGPAASQAVSLGSCRRRQDSAPLAFRGMDRPR